MIPGLIILFALYVVLTAWQMRRAIRSQDPAVRLNEAKKLLWLSFLGVPLLVAFIFAI